MKKTPEKVGRKIFLDCEFTGLHRNTTLISLALLAESAEEFYAEFTDYDKSQLNDWLVENVFAHLSLDGTESEREPGRLHIKGDTHRIKSALEAWFAQFGTQKGAIQIWGDCLPWDWVLFCELFGGAFGIPPSIHYMPMDLATLFYLKTGNPDTGRVGFAGDQLKDLGLEPHNALYDVHLIKACYGKLTK
ncbi:MAG: 3'-5' exoribonuclease domain-containing protein [Burkholderiales bacterium]